MGLSSLMLPQWPFNLFQLPHISPLIYFYLAASTFHLPHSHISAFVPIHSSPAAPYPQRNSHIPQPPCATSQETSILPPCLSRLWAAWTRGSICCYATSEWRRCEGMLAIEKKVYQSHFCSFQWYCHYDVGNRNSAMMPWKIGVGWGSTIQLQRTFSKLKNIAYEHYRIFIGELLVTFCKSLLRVLMVL